MHRFFGAVLTLLLIGALPARAAEDPPSATVFAEPAERVALSDGRRMNVVCLGSGSPTVLFDAGTSDWSAKWILVQPAIAPSHRSCSFDRFGMGFSDPANDDPASANVLADELHALVKAAKIDTPLILVGHSLGGALSLLYAEKFPRDVAGLVLVDPYSGIFANRANDATGGIFTARRLANLAPNALASRLRPPRNWFPARRCSRAAQTPNARKWARCSSARDTEWKQRSLTSKRSCAISRRSTRRIRSNSMRRR